MVRKTPLFFGLVLAQSHSQIAGTRSRSSPTCSCWFLIFVWLQGTLLRFRDRALVASAGTSTPRNKGGDQRCYTFSLWQCAASSRRGIRRQTRFPSPAFPAPRQWPLLLVTRAASRGRQIRCQ